VAVDQRRSSEITLAVAAFDATRILHALRVGEIRILLRNPGMELKGEGIDYVTIENLIETPQAPKTPKQDLPDSGIEIIRGGKKS
jgi:hypothetical protein